MALKRYTESADGTIPVPALLYEDEVLLTSQETVGIYDGHVHVYCFRLSTAKWISL